MQPDIPTIILSNPALVLALTGLILFAVHWQKGLTYREYRAIHIAKCRAFALLDSWATKRGRPLVRTVSDNDFVGTVQANPRAVAKQIDPPFAGHLIATAKRRASSNQWSHSQWVQTHQDGLQTEVALFSNPDGSTDVYAHLETSVTDPEGHLEDEQRHGDARGAFAEAFES